MTSKRDRLKQLNRTDENAKSEHAGSTIIDDLVQTYEQQEDLAEETVTQETAVQNEHEEHKDVMPDEVKAGIMQAPDENTEALLKAGAAVGSRLINVMDKSRVGRPSVYGSPLKPVSARLKIENYEYARLVGGKYGGINAYINYLIDEDRRQNIG